MQNSQWSLSNSPSQNKLSALQAAGKAEYKKHSRLLREGESEGGGRIHQPLPEVK